MGHRIQFFNTGGHNGVLFRLNVARLLILKPAILRSAVMVPGLKK